MRRSYALVVLSLPLMLSWARPAHADTDELKEWGIETRGSASVDETLGQARQMLQKGNALSVGGIAKRVVSGEPGAAPQAAKGTSSREEAAAPPVKRVVRSRPAGGRVPGYRILLSNGTAMTAQAVRAENDGYWVTAQEGVEAHFTSAEVLSVEEIPGY